MPSSKHIDVVVIGAGISGLVAAYSLLNKESADCAFAVTVLEASDRAGGVISTTHDDGYLVEHGPDSFLTTKPWAVELCDKLGLSDQLIGTNSQFRRAFVACDGALAPLPEGFMLMAPSRLWSFFDSPVLTTDGKVRTVLEMFSGRGAAEPADESLKSFITRHFGNELYERIAQPMVAGIYTGDPSQLSARATMPQFVELQRKYGSIIRGLMLNEKRTEGGARYGAFATLKGGVQTLCDTLVKRIGPELIKLNTAVHSLRRLDGRWSIATTDGAQLTADAVIFAVPPEVLAGIIAKIDGDLSASLSSIESASSAIINLVFSREQIAHPLNGFGFVVPERERKSIIACSFSSVKFAYRAPAGKCLLRVFLGGTLHPDVYALSDSDLLKVALRDLRSYLGVSSFPEKVWVKRWAGSMPQYKVGHLEKVRQIKYAFAAHPGLIWSGNALLGVGIPDCVKSGQDAATLVKHQFSTPHPTAAEALLAAAKAPAKL